MIDWPVAATFMTGIAGASVTITAIVIRSVVIKNGNGDLMPILTKQNETMAKLTIILNDLKDSSKDIRDNTMHIKSTLTTITTT